jgi:muramoyltetrapeptide carboxypeptidase
MNFPQQLQKGDKIAIIATARKVSKEELNSAVQLLESWGLVVEFAPNLFAEENQFAGSDELRAQDLQWAVNHPTIKAVIVARGGYGTSRMIDVVDFSGLQSYPKWFIGFSDVTVLLSHLYNQHQASIHGPVAMLLAKEAHEENAKRLKDLLFTASCNAIVTKNHVLNRNGKAQGELIGGNLTIIHTLLATNSDIDFKGKLLFIEDLDEYLYHIDRMLVHLDRAGKLKNLAGLVVGHMSDMNDNAIPFGMTAEQIIAKQVSDFTFPVAFGVPIGHEVTNYPVIVGANYEFEVTNEGSILSFVGDINNLSSV